MKAFKTILFAALAFGSAVAMAQGYPSRPVTIINAFPPGGATDTVTRQVAAKLSERLGQQFVVENKPGAAGTIGAAAVARAEPDGHTLLFGVAANLAVAPAVLKNAQYDPSKAFAAVIEVARGPYVLSVAPSLPARNLQQLIDYAKKNPGKLNYGSPGKGSVHHLTMELFKRATAIDLVHIPYKGTGPVYTAVLGGRIEVVLDSMPGPLAHIQSGSLRPLAVTGAKRLPALKDVPTLDELGVKGVDSEFWWGIVAPAGTPRDIVAKLNAEIARALADPQLAATFAKWNIETTPGTPEAFGSYVTQEFMRWKAFVANSGLDLN